MQNKSKILGALLESGRSRPTEAEILEKGDHVINSAIHLIEEIRVLYGDEAADRLELRLLRAIKTKNPDKFRITEK